MPIRNAWHCLDDPRAVDRIPGRLGVYELGNKNHTIIYIGHSPTAGLKERISNYIDGKNPCIKRYAIYFRFESTENPEAQEIQLFCQFKRTHKGKRPQCNKQDPSKGVC